MKTFKQYRALQEARRNPDQNPKISLIQALEPYKNDPDIYISFTVVSKIGINPQSSLSGFSAPLGIYVYPLKEMWGNIEDDTEFTYGDDRPYVWVLRSKNKKKFIKDLYKDYNEAHLKTDLNKIRKLLPIGKFTNEELDFKRKELERVIEEGKDDARYPHISFNLFWEITSSIASEGDLFGIKGSAFTTRWNVLLRKMGYTGFADKSGKRLIDWNEPIQGVFLTKDAFIVVDKLKNKISKP